MATISTCTVCGTRNRIAPRADGVPRCSVCHAPLPWIVDATQDTFDEEIRAAMPVLVDFWAPWCGPCRMVSPTVEKLGREHAGRLKVVKLDVDTAPQIAARFDVMGIPLLVLMRDGQEVDRRAGALPEPQLRSWIEPQLAAPPAAAAEPPASAA